MPVSPQDFATWSELTGNPYPQTPGERMALAPQVYEFNRNLGRRGGPEVNPLRRAVDVVGKAALAAGALAGAAYLGSKYIGSPDSEVQSTDSGEEGIRDRIKNFLLPAGVTKLELDNEPELGPLPTSGADLTSQVVQNSGDVTRPTTAQNFNQNLNVNQTSVVQQAKGLSPVNPTTNEIEQKPVTQSEVIGSQQTFSPGTEQEMLGQGAAERAAAFRKSKAYAAMQQRYPSLQSSEEELIGGAEPVVAVEAKPMVLTDVNVGEALVKRQPAQASVAVSSPIAEMATPAQAPVTAAVGVSGGPSLREIRDMDITLSRSMASHSPEQRAAIRDQLLSNKYASRGQSVPSQSTSTPTEVETVVTPTQPVPVRVAVETTAKPARVRANEFLSQMSQEQGPIATYEIEPSRSKAVSGVAFYPGGEIGVTVPTKTSGKKEYAFATSDPYRLALSDYAEEGFPTGMGSITGTVAPRNLAHQLGLQKTVTPGGSLAADQPSYSGLMDAAQIAKKLRSRSENVRSQAQYHADTKEVLNAIESRHPQPPMSPEEISRLRQERQAIRSVGLS